jgi:N5-(cytidine 5'-diphosphoramidyl)-L-glutamine hydrolase
MIIGLTTRLDAIPNTNEVRASIDTNWFEFLNPLASEIKIVQTFHIKYSVSVKDLDFLILTGGNDVYEVCNSTLSKKRDEIEMLLIKDCITYNIPLLGICRGMQIISKYFGGTFTQLDNHVRTVHCLNTTFSWLESVNFSNSFHNWGILPTNMPPHLVVGARCENDESIEAFEHPTFKIRGVMWHPERWDQKLGEETKYYENQRKILDFTK